jgi:aryl-alcohol dehydrogenase-like predicted oxidoreductase
MDYIKLSPDLPEVSRICLGTWAMGGWLWGGTNDDESVETINKAIEQGINFIDTAPVYGFGASEKVVGRALKENGKRKEIVIATKTGLEWQEDEKVFRNGVPANIRREVEDSLTRLQTDYIDLFQIHWPDDLVPIEETARTMEDLHKEGKIRAVGVSNYSVKDLEEFKKVCPLHSNQPPFNLFERAVEHKQLEYCNENNIVTLAYGALCRGMLSGRMTIDTKFEGDDLRNFDPKFDTLRFPQYVKAVTQLNDYASKHYGKKVIDLALRWILDKGNTVCLWGARKPTQMDAVEGAFGWSLNSNDMKNIDAILTDCIQDPVGPEFMESPLRDDKDYKGLYPV